MVRKQMLMEWSDRTECTTFLSTVLVRRSFRMLCVINGESTLVEITGEPESDRFTWGKKLQTWIHFPAATAALEGIS